MRPKLLLLLATLTWPLLSDVVPEHGTAKLPPETQSALDYFTHISARLLSTHSPELAKGFIELYPRNRYEPEVHRILQVAANLYEATSKTGAAHPELPIVYRPVFTNTGSAILISGFVEAGTADFLDNPWLDLQSAVERAWLKDDIIRSNANVIGQPVIIGVRKGFPSFNKAVLQSDGLIFRSLRLLRMSPDGPPTETNQQHTLSLTNFWAVEAWNSYTQTFSRTVELRSALRSSVAVYDIATNPGVLLMTSMNTFSNSVVISEWPGFLNGTNSSSFTIPIATNQAIIPTTVYVPGNPGDNPWERLFTPLRLGLRTTNWLFYALIDKETGRVLDLVNIDNLITRMLVDPSGPDTTNSGGGGIFSDPTRFRYLSDADMWVTNRPSRDDPAAVTLGILNQIKVSTGTPFVGDGVWSSGLGNVQDKLLAIDQFTRFLAGRLTNIVWQAPFTPRRRLYQRTSWEANDPLVHSRVEDLTDPLLTGLGSPSAMPTTFDISRDARLGQLNGRYRPWGGNPNKDSGNDRLAFAAPVKDPLIWNSDDFAFPLNSVLDLAAASRVHRGTPWQTLFLKSATDPRTGLLLDLRTWWTWSGSPDTHPTNDWKLVSVLANEFGGAAVAWRPSVNHFDEPRLLEGLVALTNVLTDEVLNRFRPSQFLETSIVLNSDQANALILGIDRARQRRAGHFPYLGSLLEASELSVLSPCLNRSGRQLQYGISDEAYERIPIQLLSLLRADPKLAFAQRDGGSWLTIENLAPASCRIQSSAELREWESSAVFEPSGGFTEEVQLPRSAAPFLFYRVVQP